MSTVRRRGKVRQVVSTRQDNTYIPGAIPGVTVQQKEIATVWIDEWGIVEDVTYYPQHLTLGGSLRLSDNLDNAEDIQAIAGEYADTVSWLIDHSVKYRRTALSHIPEEYRGFLYHLYLGLPIGCVWDTIGDGGQPTKEWREAYITLSALADMMEERGDSRTVHVRNYAKLYIHSED